MAELCSILIIISILDVAVAVVFLVVEDAHLNVSQGYEDSR